MIGKLKPYPEYRDSELPQIGRIPTYWTFHRLRHCVEMRVSNVDKHSHDSEQPIRLCNYVDVYKNERITERLAFMRATALPEEISRFRLQAGDVIITKDSEDWTDIGVPAYVEYSASDLVCGYHLALLRPRDGLSGAYFFRTLQSPAIARQFHVRANGVTRFGLSHEAIKSVFVPVPPPDEQDAIVRFLDWATGRLDRAIRIKRKLIALLNEQKQAIIHRAVTRGLDPNVPLKSSGIPWLGDIPEDWKVGRVKQVAGILRGKFTYRPRNDPSLYDGEYPFIQTGAVARASKFITEYTQTLNEKGLSISRLFPKGTLVMTIAANIGDVAILTFDACFPDSIVGLIPSLEADRDYLYLVFCCMKPEFLREAPVNTQGNLNVERIGAMALPIPTIEEQRQIVLRVEAETRSVSTAIGSLEREIALIREYRTRLIADVVTGKLDVRDVQIPLEEVAESAEPLEPTEIDSEEEVIEEYADAD